ncbi:RDD family protein [Dyella psychrodurans]|uniref:RDD family protein n=1 Tax=Dyella psychrodurans TaxID=1927960 RepID=A0A370WVF1_9GAMM|nr:RDD family protein [Dyella psychrodurans]RDS80006.1 RDD family protein [Dyella psychrodurans]
MDALQGNGQFDELPQLTFAKFWPRVGAILIDLVIVGAVGYVLGMFLFDTLARLGVYARIIGFIIAISYFGVFNSRVGNGQTLAKRWLGLRVVDEHGMCLSLPRSLLRYTAFGIPFFFNYLPIDFQSEPAFVGTLVSLVLFGGTLSIFYLYVFNRRTRQSLHDLVVRSYVVNVKPAGLRLPPVAMWRGHLVVVGLIALLAFGAPLLGELIAHQAAFQPILAVQQQLLQQPHVRSAGFVDGKSFVYRNGESQTSSYLQANLTLDAPMTSDADVARAAARVIRGVYPEKSKQVAIVVRLVYGYNMVIASRWESQTYRYEPGELP